jgi:hypothetical protein
LLGRRSATSNHQYKPPTRTYLQFRIHIIHLFYDYGDLGLDLFAPTPASIWGLLSFALFGDGDSDLCGDEKSEADAPYGTVSLKR